MKIHEQKWLDDYKALGIDDENNGFKADSYLIDGVKAMLVILALVAVIIIFYMVVQMEFLPAKRKKSKLRLGLTGASGSGKTYSALLLAKGLGGACAVVDTEHGSASIYEHIHKFDVLELKPPFSPERYIEAIKMAEDAGYDTLVIDSISPEWNGSGGCLEINDELAQSKYRGNTWSAWSDTTKRHRAFIDVMLQSPLHIICTMRSKTETAQQENIQGKKSVVKLGMKSEARDGTEYEFSVVLDIIHEGHYATVSKDRTGLFVDKDPKPITVKTGETLKYWLDTGVEVKTGDEVETHEFPDWKAILEACTSLDELSTLWREMEPNERLNYVEVKDKMKEKLNLQTGN